MVTIDNYLSSLSFFCGVMSVLKHYTTHTQDTKNVLLVPNIMRNMLDMRVSLSSHFTYKNILRQVYTPILMMVFISFYGMVDGFFISNFDSAEAFAGVNLIFPIVMVVGGLGFMFGSGGSALTGKLLGEKKNQEAKEVFTLIIIATFICGIIFSIIGFFLVEPIAVAMSKITNDATDKMVEKAIIYGRVLMCGQSIYMLQNVFQNFFVVAEKQNKSFLFTLAAGLSNIFFDWLLIVQCKMGVAGAALGTMVGFLVASGGPIIYFLVKKDGLITFVKPKFKLSVLTKSCTNGVSDFIFNISASIVGILFNIQLLKYFGESGVSAYGAIMYISFIFIAIFIGYCIGICPVISYNYGAQNHSELKNVISKSLIIFAIASAVMVILGVALARPLALLFLNGNDSLVNLTTNAMRIYSISFAFCGFCIFITSMFTALNNGLVSGVASLFRTLIFQIATVFILPLIFVAFNANGGDGIWWAPTVAELLSILLAGILFFANKKKYNY